MTFVAKELSELVGERTMPCTPIMKASHPFDASAEGVCFKIDEAVYFVFEDANDGYRSMAGPLLGFVGDYWSLGGDKQYDHFRPPLKLIGTMEGNGGEVLTFRDAERGFIVFRIGTDNSDDYYPWFVAEWNPEGIK